MSTMSPQLNRVSPVLSVFSHSMWSPDVLDSRQDWCQCPTALDWQMTFGGLPQPAEGPAEDVMGSSPSDNLDTNDLAQAILRTLVE